MSIISALPRNEIGGNNHVVQVDKTVCNRRKVIETQNLKHHSSEEKVDYWNIDVYSEKIHVGVLEGKTVSNVTNFSRNNIETHRIITTDGSASYPAAVRKINCTHRIVNILQSLQLMINLYEYKRGSMVVFKLDIRSKGG